MVYTILLAAGNHSRTGKIHKIFYKIKGKPLISYTISAFEKNKNINKLIVVGKKKDFEKFSSVIKENNFKKVIDLVEGGNNRQESLLNGKEFLKNNFDIKKDDIILTHNGCNPLVSGKEINEVVREAQNNGAAIVAHKDRDTIKKVDQDNFITKTIPREKVYLAQTPQAMKFSVMEKALQNAKEKNFKGTDSSSLVEKAGLKVKVVDANIQNIKVTYPEDLEIIKSYINHEGFKES